jgi:hypothetical protein
MMALKPVWKRTLFLLALAAGLPRSPAAAAVEDPSIKRYVAEDVTSAVERPDEGCLALAVSLAFDADHIYVADAEDCAVKIFLKNGRFKTAVGRKGRGPGEFSFPSGVSVLGGRLFVADKLNHRIQVLDPWGRYLRSFGVPFAPDRALVLTADRILVTHIPSGRSGPEKLLHVFNGRGDLLWEDLPARFSGDPVFDAFRNMILVAAGSRGDFFVVFRCQERSILHYGPGGDLLAPIRADGRYVFKTLSLPVRGPRKTIDGFCWECSFDRERFYLLAPRYTEEKDLGPGDQVFVLDTTGRLEAQVSLPFQVGRMAVDGDRIYAVDLAGGLRVLRIVR